MDTGCVWLWSPEPQVELAPHDWVSIGGPRIGRSARLWIESAPNVDKLMSRKQMLQHSTSWSQLALLSPSGDTHPPT